jgi:ATP synthase F1 complex assembly factor 2
LTQEQRENWGPVIDWFCQRYGVSLKPSMNMSETPKISDADREKIRRQLLSFNFNAVQGFSFGVDALKSIILMCAVVEHKLSVEQVALL